MCPWLREEYLLDLSTYLPTLLTYLPTLPTYSVEAIQSNSIQLNSTQSVHRSIHSINSTNSINSFNRFLQSIHPSINQSIPFIIATIVICSAKRPPHSPIRRKKSQKHLPQTWGLGEAQRRSIKELSSNIINRPKQLAWPACLHTLAARVAFPSCSCTLVEIA